MPSCLGLVYPRPQVPPAITHLVGALAAFEVELLECARLHRAHWFAPGAHKKCKGGDSGIHGHTLAATGRGTVVVRDDAMHVTPVNAAPTLMQLFSASSQ